jgi:FKBP-type peptidyl-prolyl cis-trans isomerase 2
MLSLCVGTKFDSSRDRGASVLHNDSLALCKRVLQHEPHASLRWLLFSPFSFKIGVGQVIKGWDEGVLQMSKGQRANLTCTPDYAYGARSDRHRATAGELTALER